MGGLSRFSPKPDFQPAGYLPAPQQARFISEAEQAAERLPATIKSQSLKNALLKGGAKPLELEYAGIDDFISQNQGKPVSAADVLSHLRTEGPLGQLKRVEQQVPETADSHLDPVPPAYAENVRAPFDPSFASSETRYSSYTVPGKKGDFTGYREVLLEDPKNSKGTGSRLIVEPPTREAHRQANQTEMEDILRRHNVPNYEAIDWDEVDEPNYINHGDATRLLELHDELEGGWPQGGTGEYISQGPVDAHRADYWTRYNEYPDRIAVQNIQSDLGQDYTKSKPDELRDANLDGINAHLRHVQQARRQISQDLAALPQGSEGVARLEAALHQLGEEEAEIFAAAEHHRFEAQRDADGNEVFGYDSLPVSPLAKDSNWKNLMARHIALQSIQGMGKPITIPTGQQMVDVEGFGRGTHHNDGGAAKAATEFNTDLVRRLQKIFRGLHPDGAEVDAPLAPEAVRDPIVSSISESQARLDRKESMAQQAFDLDEIIASREDNASSAAMEQPMLTESELAARFPLGPENGFPVDEGAWSGRDYDLYQRLLDNGLEKLPKSDRKIYDILSKGKERVLLEILLKHAKEGDISPEFQDAAMQAIQHDRLMFEMGEPGVHGGGPRQLASRRELRENADAPGWTIKPSPMAVRQALEKGLPIMSLAPLLLSPQEEQR